MTMKSIYIIAMFILVLSTPVYGIKTNKIQPSDNWTYSSAGTTFNETAQTIKVFQDISMVRVQTDRKFPILEAYSVPTAMNSEMSLDVNLNFASSALWLTQSGALPIQWEGNITGTVVIDGKIKFTVNSTPYFFSRSDSGDPAKAIATNEPTTYWMGFKFSLVNETGEPERNIMRIQYAWLISSVVSDANFTIQPVTIALDVLIDNQSFDYESWMYYNANGNGLSTDATPVPTYEMTLNETEKVPLYIRQTEPVQTSGNGLSLSQSTQIVEYFLVQDEESGEEVPTPSSKLDGFLFPVFGFVMLVTIMSYRKIRK